MSRTTVDVHVLQTVPPSNINRDDTGSPKTAVYGGVRRVRVSSQAWKRAARRAFDAELDASDLGVRTKRVVELVAEDIRRQAPDLDDRALQAAGEAVTATGIKVAAPRKSTKENPVPDESGYLVFLSRRQVQQLATLGVQAARTGAAVDKKAARAAADSSHSIDVALFGRMVADASDLNVDAACQVAHALSVHAADTEFDYFTAVDDRSTEEEPGAGMIGTVEFTSSTMYRYATVDVGGLAEGLGDGEAARRAVAAFLRAFVTSMPTGKQNTFANRTLPDATVVMVRDGQSVNLVGAFEEAVVATPEASRLQTASRRLAEHAQEVDAAYGTTPRASFVVRVGSATDALDALGDRVGLDGLVDGVVRAVTDQAGSQT